MFASSELQSNLKADPEIKDLDNQIECQPEPKNLYKRPFVQLKALGEFIQTEAEMISNLIGAKSLLANFDIPFKMMEPLKFMRDKEIILEHIKKIDVVLMHYASGVESSFGGFVEQTNILTKRVDQIKMKHEKDEELLNDIQKHLQQFESELQNNPLYSNYLEAVFNLGADYEMLQRFIQNSLYAYLFHAENLNGKSLNEYLIVPLQRMMRYQLIWKEVANADPSNLDHQNLINYFVSMAKTAEINSKNRIESFIQDRAQNFHANFLSQKEKNTFILKVEKEIHDRQQRKDVKSFQLRKILEKCATILDRDSCWSVIQEEVLIRMTCLHRAIPKLFIAFPENHSLVCSALGLPATTDLSAPFQLDIEKFNYRQLMKLYYEYDNNPLWLVLISMMGEYIYKPMALGQEIQKTERMDYLKIIDHYFGLANHYIQYAHTPEELADETRLLVCPSVEKYFSAAALMSAVAYYYAQLSQDPGLIIHATNMLNPQINDDNLGAQIEAFPAFRQKFWTLVENREFERLKNCITQNKGTVAKRFYERGSQMLFNGLKKVTESVSTLTQGKEEDDDNDFSIQELTRL